MDRIAKDLVALPSLNEGEEGIIQEITGGHVLASRLAGLGIVPGARVKLLRGSGGPVIVEVAGTRVALGAGEASKIMLCRVEPVPVEEPAECKTLLVALAGQPNVGKSTVFNILTGLSQHVGNWPGKTVEKKEGTHTCENVELRIVDLPGTYSLTAFSEEERVARDFIINVTPDVIVLLVNAAALERSLYLLSELLLLGPPVIVAVNMIDVAEAQGIRVDVQALQKALGIPVVPMVATKNRGIRDLLDSIIALSRGEIAYNPRIPNVSADHQAILAALTDLIADYVKAPYTVRWTATKLMEGDPEISQMIEKLVPAPVWSEIQRILVKHEDALHAVVGGRYDWVEEVTRAAISRPRLGQVLITDRIDHVLTR
ncbi:MAG: 50S ribosome-binding GTPase, partial [Syntrophobacterales bacterium]|nr:50S ribosome-binding GTPase [Syntrophobacterales bacterium]